jgi:DNA-binding LytR/AlgR family response regulator
MNYRKRFLINKASFSYKLSVSEIAIFHLENKITYAVDFSERKHPLELTLDEIFNELDPVQFYRANRQTIINIDAIARVENWFNDRLLVFTNSACNKKIIISRAKKRHFLENWLDQ